MRMKNTKRMVDNVFRKGRKDYEAFQKAVPHHDSFQRKVTKVVTERVIVTFWIFYLANTKGMTEYIQCTQSTTWSKKSRLRFSG
jgi:hypothetical protein